MTETGDSPVEMKEKAQTEPSEKDEQLRKTKKKEKLYNPMDNLRTTFGTMRLTGRYERLVSLGFDFGILRFSIDIWRLIQTFSISLYHGMICI